MNEQLRRIQFVTRYYDWLQGLRFLPLGLALLGFAAWQLTLPLGDAVPPKVRLAVLSSGVAAALALYTVMGRYYRRRFGDVRPSAATKKTRWTMLLTFLVAGLALSQGLLLLKAKGSSQPLPIVQGILLGAVAKVAYWAWTGRFVRHYLYVAGAMGVVAVLHQAGLNPLCALLHTEDAASIRRCDTVTFHAAWGLAILVMSVLDHRLLVRTLRPAVAEEPESPTAPDEAGREAAG